MTTNTETPARYAALLAEIHDDALPLAAINSRALTLTFVFDDSHSYTPVGPLLDGLSKRNDKDLLEAQTHGGRLARHDYLMASLETTWALADVVEAPDEWDQMMDLADDLNTAGDDDRSFATFADLVDDALLALQPDSEDNHENAFVEMHPLACGEAVHSAGVGAMRRTRCQDGGDRGTGATALAARPSQTSGSAAMRASRGAQVPEAM